MHLSRIFLAFSNLNFIREYLDLRDNGEDGVKGLGFDFY
jgi:hypothetical protein